MPNRNVKQRKKILDSKKYTNMFAAYAAYWRRGYSEWAGTSSRSEYWFSYLANLLLMLVWGLLGTVIFGVESYVYASSDAGPGFVLWFIAMIFYGIAAFIPWVSMLVRRMHDAGLSAWWLMLYIAGVVPGLMLVISIVFFVFVLLPTKVADNPYHKFNKE